MSFRIPLAVPNLGWREADCVAKAVASNWVGPGGPGAERFEALVAKASGRRWAIATITGTAALHAAFALVFGRCLDDEDPMLVPENVFPAAPNALENLGYYLHALGSGQNHDWAGYGPVGDCAPAIGEPPSDSKLECYSFAANKIITCGQGGAICGDDLHDEKELRALIWQGYGRSGLFNYRMANLNAALGCAQLERLDELKAAKKRIWNAYKDAGLPMIERGASRWMATVDLPHGVVKAFAAKGIETRAELSGGVSLPCSTGLAEAEQAEVISLALSLGLEAPAGG